MRTVKAITRKCARLLIALCLFFPLALVSLPASAHDEVVYFTGQLGGSFPGSFTNIENVGGSFEPGTTSTDLNLKNSLLYGLKLGIYSKSGILGLETEVFNTNPDIKQQQQTFNEPTFGPFQATSEGNARVVTWAFNVLGRLPLSERLVVHAGVGPAILFSHLDRTNEQPQSSKRAGLNTQLGLSYFITKQVNVFGEWKFNHTRFH